MNPANVFKFDGQIVNTRHVVRCFLTGSVSGNPTSRVILVTTRGELTEVFNEPVKTAEMPDDRAGAPEGSVRVTQVNNMANGRVRLNEVFSYLL